MPGFHQLLVQRKSFGLPANSERCGPICADHLADHGEFGPHVDFGMPARESGDTRTSFIAAGSIFDFEYGVGDGIALDFSCAGEQLHISCPFLFLI